MQDARNRPMRACPDVGGRARDGSSHHDPAEKRGPDIGRALRHKLGVGAVMAPGHPVRDDRRQKRLDRAEERKADRIGQCQRQRGGVQRRKRRDGQKARQFAEPCADGFHRKPEDRHDDRGGNDRDQKPRPVRPDPLQPLNQDDSAQRDRHRRRGDRPACSPERLDLRPKRGRFTARQAHPEKILDLAGKDDDRDGGGEAHRHRIGNELDIGSQPQEPRRRHEDPRHQHRRGQPADPDLVDADRDKHDEGARRSADLEPRPAKRGHQRPADDGGVKPPLRPDTRGDGDGHRQRQRHDGDRQPGDQVGAKGATPVALPKDRNEFGKELLRKARDCEPRAMFHDCR